MVLYFMHAFYFNYCMFCTDVLCVQLSTLERLITIRRLELPQDHHRMTRPVECVTAGNRAYASTLPPPFDQSCSPISASYDGNSGWKMDGPVHAPALHYASKSKSETLLGCCSHPRETPSLKVKTVIGSRALVGGGVAGNYKC